MRKYILNRIQESLRTLKMLKGFLVLLGVKPFLFFFPLVLSFIASLFEGLGASIIIPLVKGVFDGNFNFLKNIPVLKNLVKQLPASITDSNVHMIILLVSISFTAIVVKNIINYFSNLITEYQRKDFTNKMRNVILGRLLSFGKLYFDRAKLGFNYATLMSYSTFIAATVGSLRNFLNQFIMLLVYLAILMVISWKLTFVLLLFFPFYNFSTSWIIKKISQASRMSNEYHIRLHEAAIRILTTISLVKAYTNEEREKKRFADLSETAAAFDISMSKKTSLIGPIHEMLSLVALLVIVIIAFLLLGFERSNVGILVGYFYILRRTTGLFGIFSGFSAGLASAAGQFAAVNKLLDDKEKFFVPDGRLEFRGLQKNIEFRHLDYCYIPGLPVLESLSFFAEKGKTTAVVGPTGAGKTTIISLMLRFYDCPGAIFLDGTDIREFTLKSLRKHIALVSQDTLLFNGTLRENILYGLDREVTDEELLGAAKKARLYDFAMKLPQRFNTPIGERGVKLSGGERQRVAIARALIKGAEILILDEATSSLDSITEHLIQEAIEDAIKDKTAIVIAHRLSTIKNADKIIVIEEGKLVEQGTLEELLAKQGRFYSYWQAQKFD